MHRTCDTCDRVYDDLDRSTICPHDPIGGAYCREHDLFFCHICRMETAEMHPATQQLLAFFRYEHLPEKLQQISKPFAELANTVAAGNENAETTMALRKLLEAKDCAVRAAIS